MEDYSREFYVQRIRSWRKKFKIEDERREEVYSVKKTMMNNLIISDADGNEIAKIKQCISLIVPRYRICIENEEPFSIRRKFSLASDYVIKGMPWTIYGDYTGFRYFAVDQDNKAVLEIQKGRDKWHNGYSVKVSKTEHALRGICITLAIDAAATMIASMNNK